MSDDPDYVLVEDEQALAIGCRHCAGVVRIEGERGKRGKAKMLFIEDHRLSCSWGHGPYQPIPEVEQRLESRLRQEEETHSTQRSWIE